MGRERVRWKERGRERKEEGEGDGWRDRKSSTFEVWRNSTLLQANCRLRHRGTDERGGDGREEGE